VAGFSFFQQGNIILEDPTEEAFAMHIYKNKNNEWIVSVTEIIQKTRKPEDIQKLENSIEKKKIREGKSDADWDAHMNYAQERGNITHAYMETYVPLVEIGNQYVLETGTCPESPLKNIIDCRKEFESNPLAGEHCKAISKFIYDLNKKTREWKLLTAEAVLINEEYQYGGRIDSLMKIKGKNVLVDLKTNDGYWSNWEQRQVCHWETWAKAFNGSYIPPDLSPWEMVDSKLKDKFIQLALYTMSSRDMLARGAFNWEIEDAGILVAFPNKYQYIPMEKKVWDGCFEEAEQRIAQYMKNHLEDWKIRAKRFVSENPDIQI
jgi:hypothetical protein